MRCPFQVPILITECGVDIGGGQRDGWRVQGLTHTEYAGQLSDYRDILLGDPRVKGATIFCYGSSDSGRPSTSSRTGHNHRGDDAGKGRIRSHPREGGQR